MATLPPSRSAHKRLLDFFAFDPGEVRPTLLLTLYLLLAMASVISVKAASEALYLARFDATTLPYVYVAVAVVVGFVGFYYIKLSMRLPQNLLLIYTQLFFASNLVLFWWLLRLRLTWMPAIISVWAGAFTVILPTQVWTLANHIFTTRQARRLFSFVGGGGILGAALGGQFNGLLATRIGAEKLLLTYVPFLFGCAAIVGFLWRTTRHLAPTGSSKGKQAGPSSLAESVRLVRGSRYLSLIALLVVLSAVVGLLAKYEFFNITQREIADRDRMAAFFSYFSSYLAVFSFLMHLILTSRVMRWFGLNFAIFVLPLAMLLGSTVLVFSAGLVAGVLIKGSDQTFRHSIDRSSTELLYVPLPARVRQQAKSFIDMVASRWADGLGGALLIPLARFWHLSMQELALVNLALVIPWLAVAWSLRREYVNTLRTSIERRDISAEALLVELAGSSHSEEITATLTSSDDRAVETGLGLLQYGQVNVAYANLASLLTHLSPTIRRKALGIIVAKDVPGCASQVTRFLYLDDRIDSLWQALDYLEKQDGQDFHSTLHNLMESPYLVLRGTAAARLLTLPDSSHRAKAHQVFTAFVESARAQPWADRRRAAELLGLVPAELDCQSALADFLADSDPEVVRAAAISAGRARQRSLFHRLVELAGDRQLRTEARQALTAFGAEILPALRQALLDARRPLEVRRSLVRVFSSIGGQQAAEHLVLSLDQISLELQYEALRALSRIRLKQPEVRLDAGRITPLILGELRRYYRYRSMLGGVPQTDSHPGVLFLRRALAEQLDRKLEVLFRLIGLLYPAKDIFDAYYGISSGRRDLRANALEFLDNLLLNPVRQMLLPIIEDRAPEHMVQHARSLFGIEPHSYPEALRALLAESDPWLQACALYAAADEGMRDMEPLLEPLLNAEDVLLRETALSARNRLRQRRSRAAGSPLKPPEPAPSQTSTQKSLWKP